MVELCLYAFLWGISEDRTLVAMHRQTYSEGEEYSGVEIKHLPYACEVELG